MREFIGGRNIYNSEYFETDDYSDNEKDMTKAQSKPKVDETITSIEDFNNKVCEINKYIIDNDVYHFNETFEYIEHDIKYNVSMRESGDSNNNILLIFRDTEGTKRDRKYGKPALITFLNDKKVRPDTILEETYYEDDLKHRIDGPAHINHMTGKKSYFIEDKKFSYLKFKFKSAFYKKPEPPSKTLTETVSDIKNEQETLELKKKKKRESALTESSKKIEKLNKLLKKLDHYLLNSIYDQTLEIHNKFEENDELNVKYLNQMHEYYTNTLFDLLEKITFNIEHNESSLKNVLKRKKMHLEHLSNEFDSIKNSTEDINKYVNDIEIQLSALYNSHIGYNDFRLLPVESVFNIDYYIDIKNLYLYDDATDDIKIQIGINYFKNGWAISEDLLEIMHNNRYVINYIGSIINKNLESDSIIELYETGDTVFCLNNSKFSIVEEYNKKLFDEKNTWNFQLTNKINAYKKEIKKLEHDYSNVKIRVISTKIEKTLNEYIDKLTDFNINEDDVNLDTAISEKTLNEILNIELLKI